MAETSGPTFRMSAEAWLERQRPMLTGRAAADYERNLRRLFPHVADVPVVALDLEQLREAFGALRGRYAETTLDGTLRAATAVLQDAIATGARQPPNPAHPLRAALFPPPPRPPALGPKRLAQPMIAERPEWTRLGPDCTLGEFADRWLERVHLQVDEPTAYGYRLSFRLHLQPLLGIRLVDLDLPTVRDVLWQLRYKTPKGGIVKTAYVALSSCFTAAKEVGLVKHNPCGGALRKILLPRRERMRADEKAMPVEHLDRFVRALVAEGPGVLADVLFTLIATGARIGEVLPLRAEDLDETRSRVRIAFTWSFSRLGPPKGRRVRYVNVPPELFERLAPRCDLMRGRPWLFPSLRPGKVRGKLSRLLTIPVPREWPLGTDYVYRGMRRILAEAGLPLHYSPHSTRHTWASRALEVTNDLLYVSRQLGHADIHVTADLYGAAAEPKRPEVVEFFGRVIARRAPGRDATP